jgi:hypothetical protein
MKKKLKYLNKQNFCMINLRITFLRTDYDKQALKHLIEKQD